MQNPSDPAPNGSQEHVVVSIAHHNENIRAQRGISFRFSDAILHRGIGFLFTSVFIIIIVCSSNASWDNIFMYHPIFMMIAFAGILPELLNSIARLRGPLGHSFSYSQLVQQHRNRAIAFKVVTSLGIVMIEWSKFSRGKFHFKTWHSIIGAMCEFFLLSEAILGIIMYYARTEQSVSLHQRIRLRCLHRWCGVCAVLLGFASIFIGMWSSFAMKTFGNIVIRVFCGVLPVVLAFCAYQRQ